MIHTLTSLTGMKSIQEAVRLIRRECKHDGNHHVLIM